MSSPALSSSRTPSDSFEGAGAAPLGAPAATETAEFREALYLASVLENSWLPQKPTERQATFLYLTDAEAMYGGAAGGGKSSALLMAALQFADVPNYAAILFRRTYADLSLPGALMDRAKEWLSETAARWSDKEKTWHFPSGATLTFGHLEHEDTKYRYQSSEFQFIGFDELTQFSETQYRYLFSRLRRLKTSRVPLRMRSASNPGGVGHDWVKRRFLVEGAEAGRTFVPAMLTDNPHLDRGQYVVSLSQLDPITKAQLLSGDWNAYQGGRFRKEWFRVYTRGSDQGGHPVYRLAGKAEGVPLVSCWNFITVDPAASEKETADHTAIVAFGVTPNRDLLILDVVRKRLPIDAIVPTIAGVCQRWKPSWVGIESAGFQIAILNAAQRHPGIPTVMPLEPEGKGKLVRATPAIIKCEAGQVFLPESAPWLEDFVAELVQFTGIEGQDAADDQVDCVAYAVQQLDRYGAPIGTATSVENSSSSPMNDHIFGDSFSHRRPGAAHRHIFGGRR
jgi:predicted phage terminase large subunit-like protein